MNFCDWFQLHESSLSELYKSAVEMLPTTKRQHATNTIKLTHLDWVPYLGLKTLFVKALAQNEGREYSPIILFKNVQYTEDGVKLTANNGNVYKLKPLSLDENNVLVRCQCLDFKYRFKFYNYQDHSLYGDKGKKYIAKTNRGPCNPNEAAGLCKHLMKLIKVLQEAKILD